jgi:hypothetical protein
MKTHRSFLFSSFALFVLASLLGGCSPTDKLSCPEPGDAIPAPGLDEEYVSFIAQKYEYSE